LLGAGVNGLGRMAQGVEAALEAQALQRRVVEVAAFCMRARTRL